MSGDGRYTPLCLCSESSGDRDISYRRIIQPASLYTGYYNITGLVNKVLLVIGIYVVFKLEGLAPLIADSPRWNSASKENSQFCVPPLYMAITLKQSGIQKILLDLSCLNPSSPGGLLFLDFFF